MNFNFLVRDCTVLHDARCAQCVATNNEVNLCCKLCEEHGFFNSRVSTANHDDFVTAEKEAVTRGTRRDAMANELGFTGQIEHQRLCASGHNDGVSLVFGVANPHLEGALREVDFGDFFGDEFCTKALCLRTKVHHEFWSHDSLGKAGEVLYLGGEHELSAWLIAAGTWLAFDHEWLE